MKKSVTLHEGHAIRASSSCSCGSSVANGRLDTPPKQGTTVSNGGFALPPGLAFSPADLSPAQDALLSLTMESLAEAIKNLEQASNVSQLKGDVRLPKVLESVILQARALQSGIVQIAGRPPPSSALGSSSSSTRLYGSPGGPGPADGSIVSSQYPHTLRKTMSVLSDDSFVSALEELVPQFPETDVLNRKPLRYKQQELIAYLCGVKEVHAGNVNCRVLRTEALHCGSDTEFLAKLHCIRLAFELILTDENKCDWLADKGRQLLGGLLRHASKDPEDFYTAFDVMLNLVRDETRHSEFEEELKGRCIPTFTFYDVLLDFILLDAFDDLAHPPASVTAVTQNRFLSESFKETTLGTVVWSVLKAKRARLKVSGGFIDHFYDISEKISPVLAWGFLGTNLELHDLCVYFKDQICSFLSDIFNFERVRFTSFEELAEDVWLDAKKRIELTEERFAIEWLEE